MSEHGKRSETLGISHSVESNAKCFFLSLNAYMREFINAK